MAKCLVGLVLVVGLSIISGCSRTATGPVVMDEPAAASPSEGGGDAVGMRTYAGEAWRQAYERHAGQIDGRPSRSTVTRDW